MTARIYQIDLEFELIWIDQGDYITVLVIFKSDFNDNELV